ncbi:hypothetical protein [Streptomyces scabiei]|uniref:hypothetical protein n=1 Tax=Streptomyces scabiei TaxID=1930 RepID=UPI0038F78314
MTIQPGQIYYSCRPGDQGFRIPLDHLTSDQYDELCDQLDALRQVARGYCPDCGRGDAAPTVEHWEQQKQRADEAERRLRNIANGHPRADAIQAEIGEMIAQTHELRDQLRATEAVVGRVRAAHDRIAHAPAYVDAIWCLDQLDAALGARPAATQATEPGSLRDQIAAAVDRAFDAWQQGLGETRPQDAVTEAVLAAITSHLDIGDAQAWCKYCRRIWNSPAHRCESDGEQRVQSIADLRDRWLMAGPPPLGTSINRWWDKRLVELNAVLNEQPGTA